MLAIRRILCPTDFSDLSRAAFELACSLARDYDAELVVCHVLAWPVAGVVEGLTVEFPPEWVEETEARLQQVRPDDPRIRVVHQLERGDASTQIPKFASELKADLIVMGTHGRGGLSRLLMGSVAEGVTRKATCPVLTVKAPIPAERVLEPATAATTRAIVNA